MKHILFLTLTLLTTPLFAGPYCMDNSEHLKKAYDTKEWHHVECYCSCDTIKGGHCIECGHLQDAQTYEVVTPTSINVRREHQLKIQIPDNPQNVLKKLAARYLQNK